MSQSEQFEVLILGSGQGASYWLGIWRDWGDGPPSWSAGGSGAPAPTSPTFASLRSWEEGRRSPHPHTAAILEKFLNHHPTVPPSK